MGGNGERKNFESQALGLGFIDRALATHEHGLGGRLG